MANTVNDVMNVIASPDYGIKNIAGTNQEILAILAGTHNSKNNIHSIVDDIRSLLQELVVVSTESKPIEMGEKTTKINPKNIQDILDETKGIRKSLINLAKIFEKQGGGKSMPTVAKLGNKASERVADAMIKDLEKQKKGGGMSAIIDAFTKLKNISLKDIIFGKLKLKQITKTFKNAQKDLNIKEKDLNAVIKLVNAAPEMIKSLSKIGWRVDRIIKNNIVKKLSDILVGKNSILTLSQKIQKQKKVFADACEASKNIKGVISSFNKTIMKLMLSSLMGKFAGGGIKTIQTTFSKLMPLVKNLNKNKKDIDKANKVARKITVLIGNLLLTTVFLTTAAITGIPAIVGALILWGVVKAIMPAVKLVAKNKRHIGRAIGASIVLLAFTGLMALTSLILSSIEKIGKSVLIGSVVILGVVGINVLTYYILSKAFKHIAIGAISMAVMSLSLILFGIALGKITAATKNVSWKQVGIIATLTVLFGGAVALLGIPAVAAFILIGSVSVFVMGLALRPFAKTLGKIAKATENMKFKDVFLVATALGVFGLAIAGLGILSICIGFGSLALKAMNWALKPFAKTLCTISKATENLNSKNIDLVASSMWKLGSSIAELSILSLGVGLGSATLKAINRPLHSFVKTLKLISEMGTVPEEQITAVTNAMSKISKYFKEHGLKPKVIKNARRFTKLLPPFAILVRQLGRLKKIGEIPTELVSQTLESMTQISSFFINNPITKSEIDQAYGYKMMMSPFVGSVRTLSRLKKLKSVPIGLVYETLDAMRAIATYYVNNPIERETIKQSRKYKRMMRPFGKTLKHLAKLQKMGNVPIGLVYQTLDAMRAIATYYVNNPIERETIKQSRKYKRMMRPFGKTLGYLSKLQKMGNIPIGLVYQTLDAMRIIANYYINNPIKRKAIRQARKYKRMLRPFGKTLNHLAKLQKMGNIPIGLVQQTLKVMSYIANYFNDNSVDRSAIKSARRHKLLAKHFSVASEHLSQLKDVSNINEDSIYKITSALFNISLFYKFTPFNDDVKTKSTLSKEIITLFLENAEQLRNNSQSFTADTSRNVLFMTSSMSMVLTSLKYNTLKRKERRKARKTLKILSKMTDVMTDMSKINPSDITSVGNALLNTLDVVDKVDIGQVEAVTNMFNAFKGINKSENIINKFTESVNAFTTACKNLLDAMSNNTEAINNISAIDSSGEQVPFVSEMVNNNLFNTTNADTTNQNNGIRIANVDEIARTIAERINGALSIDVPDAQVQLLINGTGGNEWIISRY